MSFRRATRYSRVSMIVGITLLSLNEIICESIVDIYDSMLVYKKNATTGNLDQIWKSEDIYSFPWN